MKGTDSVVKQFHDRLDLAKGDVEAACHVPQVDCYRTGHRDPRIVNRTASSRQSICERLNHRETSKGERVKRGDAVILLHQTFHINRKTRVSQNLGLSPTSVSRETLSKNDIFLQIDQTRKGPLADTRGNRVWPRIHTPASFRPGHIEIPRWRGMAKPAADKEVPCEEGHGRCVPIISASITVLRKNPPPWRLPPTQPGTGSMFP